MKQIGFANKVRLFFLTLSLIGLIVAVLSSCSANKYGCGRGNPKMTWNKMVRSINRP